MDKEVYTKCDVCEKEIDLFESHYIKGYYNRELIIIEEYSCCSINCLKTLEKKKN